jgi:hypothetical protein
MIITESIARERNCRHGQSARNMPETGNGRHRQALPSGLPGKKNPPVSGRRRGRSSDVALGIAILLDPHPYALFSEKIISEIPHSDPVI